MIEYVVSTEYRIQFDSITQKFPYYILFSYWLQRQPVDADSVISPVFNMSESRDLS